MTREHPSYQLLSYFPPPPPQVHLHLYSQVRLVERFDPTLRSSTPPESQHRIVHYTTFDQVARSQLPPLERLATLLESQSPTSRSSAPSFPRFNLYLSLSTPPRTNLQIRRLRLTKKHLSSTVPGDQTMRAQPIVELKWILCDWHV